MKNELFSIRAAINGVLSSLSLVKNSVERGQIPFVERDYFNLAVALERIREAKERIDGILQQDP